MPKPDFGRLRTTLLGGQAHRVPLCELKVEPEIKAGFLGKPQPADRRARIAWEIEFATAAGYDYVRLPVTARYPEPKTSHLAAYAAGGGVRRRDWAEGQRGLVTSWEEYRRFPWPTADRVDYRDVITAAELLPPGMGCITNIRGGGIYERVWMLMGFEAFATALVDEPHLVEAIFRRIGQFTLNVWDRLVRMPGVGAMWLGDDLAHSHGPMVSPAVYRKHLFPWYRKLSALCRNRGLPLIFHSCGRIWDVIPDLIDCGIDALHPIEPKAMDIAEVKAKYGGQLCIIGNIDLGYTLTRGTPAEVEAEVRARIRELAPGGGYCLSSSNSVTEYVPLENYRAMIRAARKWGKYPIAAGV